MSPGAPPWQGRSIASSKLRMLEFSAFLEQPQDPETVSRQEKEITLYPKGKRVFYSLFEGAFYLSRQSSCTRAKSEKLFTMLSFSDFGVFLFFGTELVERKKMK